MEKKDLKIGGCYVDSDGNIFKYNDLNGGGNIFLSKDKTYGNRYATVGFRLVPPFTKATQEQIDHLDACIAAGKYVEAPEKLKFEKGRWYKYLGSNKKWIAKFESPYDSTALFGFSEYIDDDGIYKKKNYIQWLEYKNAKLITDLQEIQQYLPDGHPDRIDTIPEYVECIEKDSKIEIGKIYKCEGNFGGGYDNCYRISGHDCHSVSPYFKSHFKPSTKAAYDAQFKKDELTELPETWYITVTEENKEAVSKWRFSDSSNKLQVGQIAGMYDWKSSRGIKKEWNLNTEGNWKNEITFEQFKKWVLKENSIEPWSVGTYVVFLKDNLQCNGFKTGEIQEIARLSKDFIIFHNNIKNLYKGSASVENNMKWFATKEEAEKFAETLKDGPKGIVPQEGKWYEVEDGFGEYYLARYNGGFHCSEIINDGKYETDVDVEGNGEYRIVAEILSDDPKITGPLLEYAKKKYPIGCKFNPIMDEGLSNNERINDCDPYLFNSGEGQWVIGSANLYCSINGCWARVISLPEEKEEPKSTHKFKVGDSVKIVQSGYGIGRSEIGRIVTITELGEYFNENGYKISPAIDNSESSIYKGFNGEASFELVKEESKLEEANRRFKVGMKVKTPTFHAVITLNEKSFPTQFINEDVCTGCGNYILYDADLDKWATIIDEEKVEESWVNDIIKESKATGWMISALEYEHKPSLNLISFDDEPVIFSRPNRVNSINAELLVIEE